MMRRKQKETGQVSHSMNGRKQLAEKEQKRGMVREKREDKNDVGNKKRGEETCGIVLVTPYMK